MPTVIFINADGTQQDVEANAGSTVMQAAVDNGIDAILAECGGACSCATCHCYVDPAWTAVTGEADDVEKSMLDCVVEPKENSRLSCQITLTDDMDGIVIHLPAAQY
jgi:2Fe-2S ferredoxin